jgi:mono/diheme cytochrome c family protein
VKLRFHLLPRASAFALVWAGAFLFRATAGESPGAAEFRTDIRPILETYCFECHGDGMSKGKVAFDGFKSDQAAVEDRELWWNALKNLRANLMPPAKKPRPTPEQRELIAHWIKSDVFGIDPQNPDPGRITIHRLNRVEYRNTIRDLLGVDFNTDAEFPPDDTSFGFDTIADVLTLPPMLLEKYVDAAETIVAEAVPTVPGVVPERTVSGGRFHAGDDSGGGWDGPLSLSYYTNAAVSNTLSGQIAGKYHLSVDLRVNEKFVDGVFDYNKCRFIFKVDGRALLSNEYSWQGGRPYHYEFDQNWAVGDHQFAFELLPLTQEPHARTLTMQINSVTVRGPLDAEHLTRPKNYARFFPKDVPAGSSARRQYARELLGNFARRAFRRPVDDVTVNRLAKLAESVYSQPGKTFEAGISEGMVAVLASAQFLFRDETAEPGGARGAFPFVDQYALASRLSYLLWSSMPDEELLRLAGEGELRNNLSAQVARMLKDHRSEAFIHNFTGQWLRARDIEDVSIDARSVLAREAKFDPELDKARHRFHELSDKPEDSLTKEEQDELAALRESFSKRFKHRPRTDLTGDLRRAMRMETEDSFDYVLRQDRSLLELLDCDYTFLNQKLAAFYGITNVTGDEMRRVTLPPGSVRGGILTEGTTLVVTSNPTRTSPVKRGLFVLDNILGTPPPPPPPDIPPLEDAAKGVTNHVPTLRETLAMHRKNPLCSSCHNRMDPLGLALENFNAMGMWRDQEYNEPIDATGKLITGETYSNVKELKGILVKDHYEDFYRTVTEKLLTYALGRGLDYYDVETVDQIVHRIEKANGRASALLAGVVESAPFQKCRKPSTVTASISTDNSVALNSSKP